MVEQSCGEDWRASQMSQSRFAALSTTSRALATHCRMTTKTIGSRIIVTFPIQSSLYFLYFTSLLHDTTSTSRFAAAFASLAVFTSNIHSTSCRSEPSWTWWERGIHLFHTQSVRRQRWQSHGFPLCWIVLDSAIEKVNEKNAKEQNGQMPVQQRNRPRQTNTIRPTKILTKKWGEWVAVLLESKEKEKWAKITTVFGRKMIAKIESHIIAAGWAYRVLLRYE